jgi:adenylate cyclase
MTATRRLAAILAADVAGYSRLIGADESGTLQALKAIRAELIDPTITAHNGRLVKTTGDGLLVEFGSVVDALQCATEVQAGVAQRNANAPTDKRIQFRIGINMGDIVVEDGDIFGDGVNVAARLEALAEPGGICVSARVQEDAVGKLELVFEDLGEQALKNIARPVRAYRIVTGAGSATAPETPALALPDKPSIAVLPFANMSGDPEQEYFVDGMVEEIITALSRIRWLFVIARYSSFTYKGQAVDVKQVGRELGVRYILEGSVRKAGNRVRITGQLIDAATGVHLWADRFDGSLEDVFDLQDKVASSVAGTKSVSADGDDVATFHLKRPQPALLALLASGLSPVYPCHVPPHEMRIHPIGTGPFKFVEFKPNESIRVVKNQDYWKKDQPYLDGIEYTIIPNRSTAILAFIAGKFDMTFPFQVTVPLLNGR